MNADRPNQLEISCLRDPPSVRGPRRVLCTDVRPLYALLRQGGVRDEPRTGLRYIGKGKKYSVTGGGEGMRIFESAS